ncbi:MAG: glycine cleavage system aminomethyltransferase GcvT [Halobacteria archaeon]|nr:glycine cleavage system aminomethyltransferase GcvT [Halobacteria archaeon]
MDLRNTPLTDLHESHGAKFTDFGGWNMPVEFDSIKQEHNAVRDSVGKFDISHMGEIYVEGKDAETLMQRLVTNDVTRLSSGGSQYAMITDENGIIIDDTIVYKLPDRDDSGFLFVPNAGHDAQMYDRWTEHREKWGLEAEVENKTEETAMFAVQGPDSEGLMEEVTGESFEDLSKFKTRYSEINGVECLVSRTGYTGEDGFELVLDWESAERVWGEFDCQPCGLGARDTLRTEMGYLLSGQDFDPEDNPRNPYEAGVSFTVKLDKEFVGRDALEQAYEEGVDEKLVGFRLIDRGIPRHGYDIKDQEGEKIGEVTSGTMSPTLNQPIGLGYVPTGYTEPGTSIRVDIRGQAKKAKVEKLPFIE